MYIHAQIFSSTFDAWISDGGGFHLPPAQINYTFVVSRHGCYQTMQLCKRFVRIYSVSGAKRVCSLPHSGAWRYSFPENTRSCGAPFPPFWLLIPWRIAHPFLPPLNSYSPTVHPRHPYRQYCSECGWRTPHFGPQQNSSLVHRKNKKLRRRVRAKNSYSNRSTMPWLGHWVLVPM